MAVTIADQVLVLGKAMASQPPNPAMNVRNDGVGGQRIVALEPPDHHSSPEPDGPAVPGVARGTTLRAALPTH